ncbi:MAG: TVP38/TMEM64 family protein [Chloroflexi bacterium]|nr:TVP38/TMEM64 family protein [Chloroflexota bacterium]
MEGVRFHSPPPASGPSHRTGYLRWVPRGTTLLLLFGLGVAVGPALHRWLTDREAVQAWVLALGPWGPLGSILLNAAQVLLAPVPGQIFGLANGYLYGVLRGTFYSWLGVQLGSALAMGLGRWLGRPLVARLVGPARLERWDGLARQRGPTFFLLVFLLPLLPDDLACFVIGLSPLPIPYMLLLAGVGRLPGLIVASWVGANATRPPAEVWAGLVGGALVLTYLFGRYRERVENWLLRTFTLRNA